MAQLRYEFPATFQHRQFPSLAKLAAALGVTKVTLNNWRDHGLDCQRKDGRYCSRKVKAWIESRNSELSPPPRGPKPGGTGEGEDRTDKARREKADADLAELKVSRLRGELVKTADVKALTMRLAEIIRRKGEDLKRMGDNTGFKAFGEMLFDFERAIGEFEASEDDE